MGRVSGKSLRKPGQSTTSSGFYPDQYTLVQLSKVGDANGLDTLDKEIEKVNEVPSIQALNNRS